MRRFWAYLITAITTLLLVGVSFGAVMLKANSNLEYQFGRELVFRVADKDNAELVDDTAVKNIAEVMDSRLKTAGETSYTIKTVGFDTIKVSVSKTNNEYYEMISNYLTFNASLALTTDKDEVALMSEFLTEEKAYLTDTNSIPQIAIPVDNTNAQFRAVVEAAKKEAEDMPASDDESGESNAVYMYLWYDFVEDVDSVEASQNDETMAKKIIMTFNIDEYKIDDESGDWDDKLVATLNIDINGDSSLTVSEIKEGYYRARFYVNLLNASELDYEVTYLYYNNVESSIESIVTFSENSEVLAFNKTALAALIALGVVTLLLVYYYRLGALSAVATSSVTLFGAIAFMVLFGVEFNAAAFAGLVVVGLVSLASSIIYFNKVKEEAYRGRTLKKANSEGSKKSTLPIVDINVVTIIIGAFVFLMGGNMMTPLAAALVLGGVLSLATNTLGLKGLMWMATNTTAFIGKYNYFGINPEKVPSVVNEEKQTYYGAFAERDFTKQKKPVGIALIVLSVASLAGMIVFGTMDKGNFFNTPVNVVENSEIHFEAVNREYAFSKQIVEGYLDNMLVYESDGTTLSETKVSDYVLSIEQPSTMTEKKMEDGHLNEYIHYYYVAMLDRNLSLETNVQFSDGNYTTSGDINTVLTNVLSNNGMNNSCSATLKSVTNVTEDKPGFGWITLATFIGVAVSGFYLVLRYRPSKGLTAFILTSLGALVAVGFMCLTRVAISTYILAMLPGVAIVGFIFAIFIMNKEREIYLEDRSREVTLEKRNEFFIKAASYSATTAFEFITIGIFLPLNFFGFGPFSTSVTYILLGIGLLLGMLIMYALLPMVSMFFIKLFGNIKLERKPGKNKKKAKKIVKKSAEPEEAVFIGIND